MGLRSINNAMYIFAVLALILNASGVSCFTVSPNGATQLRTVTSTSSNLCRGRQRISPLVQLSMSNNKDEANEAASSGPAPDEWRRFRASLIEGGIKTTDEGVPEQEVGVETERRVVSQGNEKLLQEQNKLLADEYIRGVWAHETPEAEVGGLLCRLPIEAQLSKGVPMGGSASEGGTEWGKIIASRLEEEAKLGLEDDETEVAKERFASWSRNTAYLYRVTQKLIEDKIHAVIEGGHFQRERIEKEKGAKELIIKYAEYQDSWQEVVLMLDSNVHGSSGVVINRPLASGIGTEMGCRVLLGRQAAIGDADVQLVWEFCTEFGDKGVFYRGGGLGIEDKGICLHGIAGLEGAQEISPGTGIYRGGEFAAIQGVLSGHYDPLDFRWFLGRKEWRDANLEQQVSDGRYQPVACARSVAIKQCIALPKPLWHEVMELCGGKFGELSKLEIQKRDDLSEAEK